MHSLALIRQRHSSGVSLVRPSCMGSGEFPTSGGSGVEEMDGQRERLGEQKFLSLLCSTSQLSIWIARVTNSSKVDGSSLKAIWSFNCSLSKWRSIHWRVLGGQPVSAAKMQNSITNSAADWLPGLRFKSLLSALASRRGSSKVLFSSSWEAEKGNESIECSWKRFRVSHFKI